MLSRFTFLLLSLVSLPCVGQWTPGEVYREYSWVTPEGFHEAFLRVGGKYGYKRQPGKLPEYLQDGEQLILPENIDLQGALRAEVILEKVMSHEDSRNLRLEVNGNAPIDIPEPAFIPEPQTEYMYHTAVMAPVPLAHLRDGEPIRFRLSLDSTQRWDWPQNIFYAVTFRIYYTPDTLAAPAVTTHTKALGEVAYLSLHKAGDAVSADFIFVGQSIDWSGRGTQYRKHWQTFRGKPHHIIGQSTDAENGFSVRWNTAWLPDQPSFGVQARVLGADGKYRVTPVLEGFHLAPRPYVIKAYAPGPAPRNWVTRSGAFEQTLRIPDSVSNATALRLNWVSWSPCYSNGVFLNGHLLWHRSEDCYVFATHSPTFSGHDVETLQQGENIISTGLTPRFRGKMVHGMEVQWPGVQVLVRYE